MGTFNDNVNNGITILRDHDSGVINTYDKSVSYGATSSSQETDSGFYNLINYGDIACWGYWPPSTRDIGIYAQAVPVKVVSGGVLPILDSSMTVDSSFGVQAVNAIDGSIPSIGDFGMVVQAPNQDTQVSVFIPIGSGKAAQYARIAWNWTIDDDLSEGELTSYDVTTKEWLPSGTLIWIDSQLSNAITPDTAGDGTYFEVEAIGEATRFSETRPLYRVKNISVSGGPQITHFRTINYFQNLDGYLLSDDLSTDPVWKDEGSARIKTTIGTIEKDNRIIAKISREWDLSSGIQEFKFLEISDIRSLNIYFRPISPVVQDLSNGVYESSEKDSFGNPIATYRRKL